MKKLLFGYREANAKELLGEFREAGSEELLFNPFTFYQ